MDLYKKQLKLSAWTEHSIDIFLITPTVKCMTVICRVFGIC